MPRIPTIRVHKGSQLAYVRLNGKDRYLGPVGSSQVFERYAALLATLADTAPMPTQARQRRTLAYEARYVASALVADGKSRVWTNRMMAAVRRCFKWGIGEELVPPDRLEALKAVNGLRLAPLACAAALHGTRSAAVIPRLSQGVDR